VSGLDQAAAPVISGFLLGLKPSCCAAYFRVFAGPETKLLRSLFQGFCWA
jgi:hypothetical protein